MALSAFDDKNQEPTDEQVASVLEDASVLWIELKQQVGAHFDPLSEDWGFSGQKWGWSLRLKHKKRAVLYMTPSTGFFHVGFAFGQKAVDAAQESDLPLPIIELVDSAQKYAEGRAVRLEVRTDVDVEHIVALATIKMAN